MRNLHDAVAHARSVRGDSHAFVVVIQKLVEGLQEGVQLPGIESQFAQRFREVIILLLKAFHDQPNFGQQNTNHVVTK